ncbi:MAG: phasin family protein, partial [Xanthobacteraceae bacterium]
AFAVHQYRIGESHEQLRSRSRRRARKQAATQQGLDQMGRSFSASFDNLRDFNLKMINMMRVNAEASFSLAEGLVTAKSSTDAFERLKSFAEQQVQTLQKQTQELTSLTQTVAQEAMQPVKDVADRFTKSA